MIFNYANESYYEMVANIVDQHKALLDFSPEKCKMISALFVCSIIFIPCNLTTGAPIPLCSNDCSSFNSTCENELITFVDFSKFYGYHIIQNCENTLSHLNTYFNYPNSSSDFKDNCLALPGTYVICSICGQLIR